MHFLSRENGRNEEIWFWESIVIAFSYLVYYDTLLQNAIDITKCDKFFITKCGRYYKMR